MKQLVLAVVVVMSLFAVGRANAQRYLSGNDLQKHCKEQTKDKEHVDSWYDSGLCSGYIIGVTDAYAVWNDESASRSQHPMLSFCLEGEVTAGQAIKVVERFLDNHPELLHKPAALLVVQAFHEAFPCQATQKK
jgi:hypothetical protein